MRYLVLATLLLVGLAIPASAQQSGDLSFTLSNPPAAATATTFNATIGGVKGVITTTAGGAWTMSVAGQPFASGAYMCGGGSCSFAGRTLAGKNLSSSMTHLSGTIPGLFATHDAWVSTVAGWANTHLSGTDIGAVVSQAAADKGRDTSQGPANGPSQSGPNTNQGSGHGMGGGPGGGQGQGGSHGQGGGGMGQGGGMGHR